MKALVKKEAAPGLWLEDVPVPECGINDVLIKVKRTAICGTDMHIYNWDAWAQKTIPTPMSDPPSILTGTVPLAILRSPPLRMVCPAV